ncbi:MAG: hypothetical protein IKA11_00120 [Clostridia bacterium]|nr:hypothetical protein [Clostridia bacterium]
MKSLRQTHKLALIVLSVLLALTVAMSVFFAIKPTVYAAGGTATTYDFPVASWVHADHGACGKKTLLIRAKADANTPLELDMAAAASDDTQWATFASQVALSQFGVGEITTATDLVDVDCSKPGGGFNTATDGTYIVFSYSKTASWLNATASNYVTLTIPEGASLYGVTFANDVEMYFYGGTWTATEPAVVEPTEIYSIGMEQNWNNKTHGSELVFVHYTYNSSNSWVTIDTSLNSDTLETFNNSITFTYDGNTTSGADMEVYLSTNRIPSFSSAMVFAYKSSASFLSATLTNPAVLTIPAGTVLYNIKYVNETNFYFYGGKWYNIAPPTSVNEYSIEQARNNVTTSAITSGNKVLFLYVKPTGGSLVKLNSSYAEGNFDSQILINGSTTTEIYTAKVYDTDPTIHLEYSAQADFVTNATAENPAVLTIPAGTIYYNLYFANDMVVYFDGEKWLSNKPLAAIVDGLLTMDKGASAKLAEEGKSGIRFTTNIDQEKLIELDSAVKSYSFGTIVVPYDYLDGISEPTHETLSSVYGYYDLPSTYQTGTAFKGALVDIKSSNFDRKWVGRGYVKMVLADNSEVYAYADFTGTTEDLVKENARSIYDVAVNFYEDADTEEREILDGYINGVISVTIDGDTVAVVDNGLTQDNPATVSVTYENGVLTLISNKVIASVLINGEWVNATIQSNGMSATYTVQ